MMKTQAPIIQPIENLGNGKVHVNFYIHNVNVENEGNPTSMQQSYTVKIKKDFTASELINEIVRSRYTADEVEAIVANFNKQKNIVDFIRFQNWRDMAKMVANEQKYTQSDLQDIASRMIYIVTLPFSETLIGGDYYNLADRILKLSVPYVVDTDTDTATVYLSVIYPSDAQSLGSDSRVTMAALNAIEL